MSEPTDAFDFQNFYSATLTGDIVAGTLTIPLDIAPTPSEGVLVIDPEGTAPEVIYYTSKGASSVTCPADGRGWDNSTAGTHLQGTTVIMAPTAYAWRMLKSGSLFDSYRTGWTTMGYAPSTITHNGNRSYNIVYSGVNLTGIVSNGMRIKLPRTVTPPTQCADLESGSSQYFSKTSPSGLSFTDDFTIEAWVKLESYAAGGILARRNADTEGFSLGVNATGQVELTGLRIAANNTSITSYQSLPLGRWVHVAAALDMSTTSNSLIWIDGVPVPALIGGAGTATALVQGTTALVVGALKSAGTNPFDGKIASVALYSSVLGTASIRAHMNQTYTGAESTQVSAFSLNNTLNDLNANANNLTAQGGALATNVDSPFNATEYGIIMTSVFSTNTTLVVQVPEGYTLPTTGGCGISSYSANRIPYGFPGQSGKWEIGAYYKNDASCTLSTGNYAYAVNHGAFTCPIGEWRLETVTPMSAESASSTDVSAYSTISTSSSNIAVGSEEDTQMSQQVDTIDVNKAHRQMAVRQKYVSHAAETTYYRLAGRISANITSVNFSGSTSASYMKAQNAYL